MSGCISQDEIRQISEIQVSHFERKFNMSTTGFARVHWDGIVKQARMGIYELFRVFPVLETLFTLKTNTDK